MRSVAAVSLTHGWLPATLQLCAAAAMVAAIGRCRRHGRTQTLLSAGVLGAAVTLTTWWSIGAAGVIGDPAPTSLWAWTTATGAAAVLAARAPAPWWRRAVTMCSIPLCLICAGLSVNTWVGYLPTVADAGSALTDRPLPGQVDQRALSVLQAHHTPPARGVVVPVTITAGHSGFAHRREFVYLPPAWFASNPPPRLPAVLMIGAAFNTPADWVRAGAAASTVDTYAAAHHGFAPVLVFADATGAFLNDTECVNGRRGHAADHLTKDVVPFVISAFGVSPDRANWGVAGFSMGGTCAIGLTVMHPELFSAFLDIAGDLGPNDGTRDQTIANLFGGDASAWAAFDPLTVMSRYGPYSAVTGRFDVPRSMPQRTLTAAGPDLRADPEGQDLAAHTLCTAAARRGISCTVLSQAGKHDWLFAGHAFAATLPWLASAVHTPWADPVTNPESTRGHRTA
ncbi:MAG: alpha/beta hydrolase-fold protein [Mycobacterium sp.]|nr:alpha/beta hydrolase-fold protein [Mycobacterium sp.]